MRESNLSFFQYNRNIFSSAEYNASTWIAITVCLIVVVGLTLFIIYLVMRVKKEKRYREELRQNQMYLFEKGNIGNLNPDFTVDEQAELLPYDQSYEVKKENIKFGKFENDIIEAWLILCLQGSCLVLALSVGSWKPKWNPSKKTRNIPELPSRCVRTTLMSRSCKRLLWNSKS